MTKPYLPDTEWFDGFVQFTDGFNVWELLEQFITFFGALFQYIYNAVAFFFTPISTLVDDTVGDHGFIFELIGDAIASLLANIPISTQLGLMLGDMTLFSLMFLIGLQFYLIFVIIRFILNLFGL